MHLTRCLAMLALLAGAPIAAQQAGIESQLINTPGLGAIAINGLREKPRVLHAAEVQGGQALRVAIPGADPQAWKISLSTPVTKPVKQGDTLVLAFWARTEKGPNGSTTITLPYNGLQLSHEPYAPVFHQGLTVGPTWKLYDVRGTADRDYAAGELMVTSHLATGQQTIDFGPVFVLDLGRP